MMGFAALRWDPVDTVGSVAATKAQGVLHERGWRVQIDQPGWLVFEEISSGRYMPHVFAGGRAVIVGRLFDRQATEEGRVTDGQLPAEGHTFRALCDHLTRRCWGAYVAIGTDSADPRRLDVFRDPVGMLDCVSWTLGTLRIVTSKAEVLLQSAPPPDLSIDWLRVADLLRFPGSAGDTLPVNGISDIACGTLLSLDAAGLCSSRLWSPAAVARRPAHPDRDLRARLPTLIDACIGAWSSCANVAVAELSGGLDSAIVASGVTRAARDPVSAWFHYFARDREGDERRYARAVAEHLQVPHQEILRDQREIDQSLMDRIPVSLRPNVGSISLFHDEDLATKGVALSADMLLTGQGGDALFFQFPTPLIAGDLWHDDRAWREKLAVIGDLAAWTGRSIWSVSAMALRAGISSLPPPLPDHWLDVVRKGTPRDRTPLRWMDDTADLAPAKQLQIFNLAACRAAFAGSWSSATMDVVHPLMSQPLLERVLPISALDLTRGKRDRALVRKAYAGRLPQALLERRGKGCLTPFHGRMLAASIAFVRSYLLDGALAGHHVLDCDALDNALNPDQLMQTNCYAEIFVALLMERWARAMMEMISSTERRPG